VLIPFVLHSSSPSSGIKTAMKTVINLAYNIVDTLLKCAVTLLKGAAGKTERKSGGCLGLSLGPKGSFY
jgi:hypothetical protein